MHKCKVFACLLGSMLLTPSCSPASPAPQDSSESVTYQDMWFSVSNRIFRLPWGAAGLPVDVAAHMCDTENSDGENDKNNFIDIVCLPSSEDLAARGRSNPNPLPTHWLEVSFDFGKSSREEHPQLKLPRINCNKLSQEWARLACHQETNRDDAFGVHIKEITLIDMKDSKSPTSWLVKIENDFQYNGKKIFLFRNIATNTCPYPKANPSNERTTNVCYAGIIIENNLLAVWERSLEFESRETLEKQANFVQAFIDFGIGETEDFSALKAVLANNKY